VAHFGSGGNLLLLRRRHARLESGVPDPLQEVVEKDPRYAIEAYLFTYEALPGAQQLFKRERHVSGKELLEGIKVLARERFGLMAKQVLNSWGVRTTDDFGNIVFNLVNAEILSRTEEDTVEEFHAVYDFEQEFVRNYNISAGQEPKGKAAGEATRS
jgi:uncharacterized repeat protein (TIGR04138 family)